MLELRDYQQEAFAEIRAAWFALRDAGLPKRILLVSRTGTGKTVIGGHFLERVLQAGQKANFVVRDRTLLDQTSRHLDAIGVRHGVFAAGHRRVDKAAAIQICSAQTCASRGEAPDANVLVIDEAHGVACDTSLAIVQSFPHATILGLTATAERSDGKPLGNVFHRAVIVKRTFEQLVEQGALVNFELVAPSEATKDLSQNPIDVLRAHGRTTWPDGRPRMRKTVFFCRDRAHARAVAGAARAAGFRAAHVDGETKSSERDLVRLGLPDGDRDALDVIASVDLIKQGFDCPPVELLILACGFGAWGPWIQALGRGLRPIPPALRHIFGKRTALIFDLRGCVWKLGLPSDERTVDLKTGTEPLPGLPALRSCKGCGAVFRHRPACPRCGAVAPPLPPPRVKQRALARVVNTTASPAKMREVFDELCAEAATKGWKPGAVGMRFKLRFGRWPKWQVPARVA